MSQEYFLKIEGIDGESKNSNHKGEIDVLSWSWGETQTANRDLGGGLSAGKVNMQDFHFTMQICKATPKLMLNCANGSHIPKATLTCRKAGTESVEFFKVEFEELLISSYQIGDSAASEGLPVDQVSFSYTKIKWEYKEQDAKGKTGSPIKAGWNVKENKAV